ncbi:MAG: serine hydrolase [Vicinamibacterales bacterium]
MALTTGRVRRLSGLAAVLACLCAGPLDAAAQTARAKAAPARKATPSRTTKKAVTPKKTAKVSTAPKAASKAAPKASSTSSAARRRAIARARAAARAREARALATPRFRTDDSGREVPAPRAAAALIYDPEADTVLFEENAGDQRSIASITKVMTALVFLESLTDPSTEVKVVRTDVARASTTYLRAGYTVTVDQLLHLLLIGSDNAAARVLARTSPYGTDGFIARMNEKARELGLANTHFEDPSGLLSGNVSTAYELAHLLTYAVADDRISSVMRKADYDFVPLRRNVHVNSTNRFVRSGELEVLGGKTGFISSSGYCLATLVRLPQTGKQVVFVVLGARSNAARFSETKHLFNWLSTTTLAAAAHDGAQGQ